MITGIMVILSDDSDPPIAHYGKTKLEWPGSFDEESVWRRLKIETEACLVKAYEQQQGLEP